MFISQSYSLSSTDTTAKNNIYNCQLSLFATVRHPASSCTLKSTFLKTINMMPTVHNQRIQYWGPGFLDFTEPRGWSNACTAGQAYLLTRSYALKES